MSIGERIKLARCGAGLSQRALAEKVGVSAQAISKYERDLDVPSSGVLLQLADALDMRFDYFLRSSPVPQVNPVYRKRTSQSQKAEQAILARIQDWLERYLTIEAFFPEGDMPRFEFPPGFPWKINSLSDAEQAAEALRHEWKLSDVPIENLTELLEDKGIKIGSIASDDKFDACTFMADTTIPVIAVKENLPGDRQRFNLAHELGHLMLRSRDELIEKAANRFAAALLVPAAVAQYELGPKRSGLDFLELHLLKHKYGLSMQAWIYRARDLGILSESAAQQHFKHFRSRGWHKAEPGDQYPPEQPERMTRLVLRGLAEGLLTESRAAELLGQPLPQFLKQKAERHAGFPVSMRS